MVDQLPFDSNPVGSLAARLRGIAKGRPSIEVACFQFIGLEAVQAAYGEKWPAQRAKVHAVAQDFIQKRISPDDILVHGPDGFLLVSASLSGHEAELAARNLSHALNSFFLGRAEQEPRPSIHVAIEDIDVNAFAGAYADAETVPQTRIAALSAETTKEVEWKFQAVWDARREALTSYYTVPYKKGTTERIPGYQFEPGENREHVFADLDEQALRLSELAIKRLFSDGKKALVGVSVHVSSLTNVATRGRLLSVMAGFDPELIRYRTIKIAGIPPGFPRLYLSEFIGAVKGRLPNIVLGLAWDEKDIGSLLQSGIRGIGFALPWTIVNSSPVVPQSDVLSKVRSAADAAHAVKLPFFVEGPFSADLVAKLRAAGADTISSPLVWPPSAAPHGVQAWSSGRL